MATHQNLEIPPAAASHPAASNPAAHHLPSYAPTGITHTTFTYDAEGNTTSISGTTFTFDALNNRVMSSTAGVNTRYGFDLAGDRVTTWDDSGQLTSAQYYAGSTPVAFYTASSGGNIHFQHQDWVGTERLRTDQAGNAEATYQSSPFGDNFTRSGTDDNPAHYAGLDTDDPNNQHAIFREYRANFGRWLSPDPYDGSYNDDPQSSNRYTYASNNPLSVVDPSGLSGYCVSNSHYHFADGTDIYNNDGYCVDFGSTYNFMPGSGGGDSGNRRTSGQKKAPNKLPPAVPYNVCVAAAMATQLATDKTAVDKANAEIATTAGVGAVAGPAAGYAAYGMGGNAVTSFALARSLVAAFYVKAYIFTVPPLFSSMIHASSQYKADAGACGKP